MKSNKRFVTKGMSTKLSSLETHADTCKGYSKMWFMTLLLIFLMAGCNGSNTSLGGRGGAPTVDSTVPASGATGVAVDTTITATFREAMDPDTITTTTFTLTTGGTAVAGTVALSADGLTATFTPTGDFTADTLYTATITTGAKDLNGNALAGDKVWTFTTGTGAAPTVLSTVPADGATGVLTTAEITAIFSTEMNPLTINTTNFTLTPTVTGTVTLSADGLTATYQPAVGLAASTLYVARITSGAKDINGNAAVPKTWSFTTLP